MGYVYLMYEFATLFFKISIFFFFLPSAILKWGQANVGNTTALPNTLWTTHKCLMKTQFISSNTP